MKKYIRIFVVVVCAGLCSAHAFAFSPACEQYKSNCDDYVACELTIEADNAIKGQHPDYIQVTARAIHDNSNCAKYADLFKTNVRVPLSITPPVQLVLDWVKVREAVSKLNAMAQPTQR